MSFKKKNRKVEEVKIQVEKFRSQVIELFLLATEIGSKTR